jgi:hypothetical protein
MRVTVPVAPYGLSLTFTDSIRTFNRLSATEPVSADTARGACGPGQEVDYVVGVFDSNWLTLVHECVHAANMVLARVGVNLADNDEPLAYLVEHLTEVGGRRLKL